MMRTVSGADDATALPVSPPAPHDAPRKKIVKKKRKTGTAKKGKKENAPLPVPQPLNDPEPEDFLDYKLGPRLGRGAFGCVYQGLNANTGENVAIKTIALLRFPDALDSVQAEIDLMEPLEHPNIVRYITSYKTETFLYIVMEFAEGGSLQNVQKKFENFGEHLLALHLHQVLHGLKYLHEQSIIHRDIKAANILFTKGVVKLSDFGISVKLDNKKEDSDFNCSPYWAAPEIILNEPFTEKCDIWSLGITAIEMYDGKPPYFDLNPMRAMYQIVQNSEPPLPQGISDEFRDFLSCCFKKNIAHRASTDQLINHIYIQKHVNPRGFSRTAQGHEDAVDSVRGIKVPRSLASLPPKKAEIGAQNAVEAAELAEAAGAAEAGKKHTYIDAQKMSLSEFAENDDFDFDSAENNQNHQQKTPVGLAAFAEDDDFDDFADLASSGGNNAATSASKFTAPKKENVGLAAFAEDDDDDDFGDFGDFGDVGGGGGSGKQVNSVAKPALGLAAFAEDDDDDFGDIGNFASAKGKSSSASASTKPALGLAAFAEDDDDDFGDIGNFASAKGKSSSASANTSTSTKPALGLAAFAEDDDDDFGDIGSKAAANQSKAPSNEKLATPKKVVGGLAAFAEDDDDDFGDIGISSNKSNDKKPLRPPLPPKAPVLSSKGKLSLGSFADNDDDDDDDFGDIASAPNVSQTPKPKPLIPLLKSSVDAYSPLRIQPNNKPGLRIQPKLSSGIARTQPKTVSLQIQPKLLNIQGNLRIQKVSNQKKNMDDIFRGIFSTEEDNALRMESQLMDTLLYDLDVLAARAQHLNEQDEENQVSTGPIDSFSSMCINNFYDIDLINQEKRENKEICNQLTLTVKKHPKLKANIGVRHGIIPILSVVQCNRKEILADFLPFVYQVILEQPDLIMSFCILGLIPPLLRYADDEHRVYGEVVQMKAVELIAYICKEKENQPSPALQLFISAGGLTGITSIIAHNSHSDRKRMTSQLISIIWSVYLAKLPTPRSDISRIFAQSGLIGYLGKRFTEVEINSDDMSEILGLLYLFSRGDTVVKEYFTDYEFIENIFLNPGKDSDNNPQSKKHKDKKLREKKQNDKKSLLSNDNLKIVMMIMHSITADQEIAKKLWKTNLCQYLISHIRVDNSVNKMSMTTVITECFSALFNMTRVMPNDKVSEITLMVPMIQYIITHSSPLTEFAKTVFLELVIFHTEDKEMRLCLSMHKALKTLYYLFRFYNCKDQVLSGFETWSRIAPMQVEEELLSHFQGTAYDFDIILGSIFYDNQKKQITLDSASKVYFILDNCPNVAQKLCNSSFVSTILSIIRDTSFMEDSEGFINTFRILSLFVAVTDVPKKFIAVHRLDEIAKMFRNSDLKVVKDAAMKLVISLSSNYLL